MKKHLFSKKSIIIILLLALVVSNFGLSFAYWASNISVGQSNADSAVQIGQWDFEDTALVVATFRSDHAYVLALTEETVQAADKTAIETALAAYGLLSDEAKAELITEKDLLLALLAEIIAFENSTYLDFEGYAYDQVFTGTIDFNGRNWYGNAIYISNDPTYDVWNDTRSLALKMGAYFQSEDLFINGIDKITLYHGALFYNNGASFAFKVEYELQTNPNVWLTLQEGGSDLIVSVISGTPLSYSEINVNITEALNIRFTPVISNTTNYINLDDIRIYEHVVPSSLEVETFRTVYAGVLALTIGSVNLSNLDAVVSALSSYNLLSVDAQAALGVEKALLDSLLVEIEWLAIVDAVAQFRSNHAYVLALTVGTVEVTDKPDVEDAIAAYYALSFGAQVELATDKALLDSLLAEINSQVPTETLVLEFRTNHATALALTVGTVQASDEFIIVQALNAYELLTPAAKLELDTEKALLDSLVVSISIIEATQAVVIAETSNLQSDLDVAQVLVTALPSGTEKTALQARLDAVQVIIDIEAATEVEGLISAIPISGAIALADETSIILARAAYEALTIEQKALVTNVATLISAESELANLDAATDAVIIAETSNLQVDLDAAQVLVTALPNGAPKTALQNRLNAVQDIIDVEIAEGIILSYFASNSVAVSNLNNNTFKQNEFLATANQIVDGLGVTITYNSFERLSRTNSTYNITISKNGASVTIVVSVTFFRG